TKQTMEDEKLKDKVSEEDKKSVLDKCSEVIAWLDSNQTADKDEFESQQKELEKIYNPIITKVYQAGGAPGGMPPGGMPGAGGSDVPPPTQSSQGPTIEEVD
ncbi:hypothetical protein, partial [Salmonella sp. s54925]|uniref:hypothetical protein n=1 Tax=Salmonella sp. s54925 TaxID=3159674 RepID=UPI0039806969